ncbi:hypothetical protein ACFQYP_20485 [Nonomuraea antimicrobica]
MSDNFPAGTAADACEPEATPVTVVDQNTVSVAQSATWKSTVAVPPSGSVTRASRVGVSDGVTVLVPTFSDGVIWNWSTTASGTFTVKTCQADQAGVEPGVVALTRHSYLMPSVRMPLGTTVVAVPPDATLGSEPDHRTVSVAQSATWTSTVAGPPSGSVTRARKVGVSEVVKISVPEIDEGVIWNWSTTASGTSTVKNWYGVHAEVAPPAVALTRHSYLVPSSSLAAGTAIDACVPEATFATEPDQTTTSSE